MLRYIAWMMKEIFSVWGRRMVISLFEDVEWGKLEDISKTSQATFRLEMQNWG